MTVQRMSDPDVRGGVLAEFGLVVVLRASDARRYDAVIETLLANGIRAIELTLTTPGTLGALQDLAERYPSAVFGLGTVTSVADARESIAQGARYLVTPALDLAVIAAARLAGVPVYPGALTPTEIYAAWKAGASAVKIFPAQTVGPQYGRQLLGPFPDLLFVPSGGIGIEEVPAWLGAGASAVSIGGPLIGDALDGGSLVALAARCRELVSLTNGLGVAP